MRDHVNSFRKQVVPGNSFDRATLRADAADIYRQYIAPEAPLRMAVTVRAVERRVESVRRGVPGSSPRAPPVNFRGLRTKRGRTSRRSSTVSMTTFRGMAPALSKRNIKCADANSRRALCCTSRRVQQGLGCGVAGWRPSRARAVPVVPAVRPLLPVHVRPGRRRRGRGRAGCGGRSVPKYERTLKIVGGRPSV